MFQNQTHFKVGEMKNKGSDEPGRFGVKKTEIQRL